MHLGYCEVDLFDLLTKVTLMFFMSLLMLSLVIFFSEKYISSLLFHEKTDNITAALGRLS